MPVQSTASTKIFSALAVGVFLPLAAIAQDLRVWAGTGSSTSWNTAGNWSPGDAPNSAAEVAQFGAITNTSNTTGIPGTAWNVGAIEMLDTRLNGVMRVGASGTTGASLILTLSGQTLNSVADTILRNNSNQPLTLQANTGQSTPNTLILNIGDSGTKNSAIDKAGNIVLAVSVQGGARWNHGGSGTGSLVLSGDNSGFSGGFRLSSGTVRLSSSSALGVGQFQLNGGTVNATSSHVGTTIHSTSVGGDATFSGSNMTFLGGFELSGAGATRTLTVQNTTTFAGDSASGANTASLVKEGVGTLVLSGAVNYNGSTTVKNGTLILNGVMATNEVFVESGAAIGGNGSIASGLALDAGAKFVFTLGSILTVNAGNVTFGGFGISDILGLDNTLANGTYTLINGAAAFDYANVSNIGAANAVGIGGDKSAYFETGSLSVVIIPEPSVALLVFAAAIGLGIRRRRP